MSKSGLFDDFPRVTSQQWKQKINYDLKGADYNETLVWESLEGIKVKPFYNVEDLEKITVPKHDGNKWHICQSIYCGDEAKSNVKAKELLAKGVEGLVFSIPTTTINLAEILDGINLEHIPVHFDFQDVVDASILDFLERQKRKSFGIHLNLDIIGHLARTGNWFVSKEEDHSILESIIIKTSKNKNTNPITVDTTLYQNAGANMVQQLAYGLSHSTEYLNSFGHLLKSFDFIPVFKVAIGGNYFFEIAKIKALRWLWSVLAKEFGVLPKCHIVAVPSKRNKTIYDYNVNMLRTTSECMSAILGGADSVFNLLYDVLYHKDNEFAERISRNQLILLKEESCFSDVSHAADGSFYIESLTYQLAEKALGLFKQIEKSGGFLQALTLGKIQQKITDSASKEQNLFDIGKNTLVGTNIYQNPQDRMKGDLELYPFMKKRREKTKIVPIIEKRLAEELEQKRLDDE